MSYKVELIPEAQDDFYKLDNSQRLHVKKSLIKLENQGMLAGEALHGNLAGYRKLKHKKLGLRIMKSLLLVREVITKFIQFLKNV